MNTRFMYNFKKFGSEYVPEANRANYDDLKERFRPYKWVYINEKVMKNE